MDSANYKLCVEMSDLQKSTSVGVLDAEKFATFKQKFPSYFAPKFDFNWGLERLDKKGIGFGEMFAEIMRVISSRTSKTSTSKTTPNLSMRTR